MSRTTKIAMGTIGVALGLIILAAILLALFYPRGFIREKVLAELETRLDRPITVESVDIGLFPDPRVELKGLEVGDTADRRQLHFTLESLRLRIRLLPLLRRRLEIVRVELYRPAAEIFLAEGPEGAAESGKPQGTSDGAPDPEGESPSADRKGHESSRGNRSGSEDSKAGRSESESSGAGPGTGDTSNRSPVDICIEELLIHEGRVEVFYPDGSSFVRMGGFFERLSAMATAEGDVSLEGETRIDTLMVHLPTGTLGRGIPLQLQKKLHYSTAEDLLSVEQSTLDMGGLPVELRGTVAGVTAGALVIDLTLEGGPASVASIVGYLPLGMFPAIDAVTSEGTIALKASVTGPLSNPGTAASRPDPGDRGSPARPAAALAPLDFEVELNLSEGRLLHPGLSNPIEGIQLQLHANPDTVEITDLAARTGRSRIRLGAIVSDYQTAAFLNADLEADLDLEDVSSLWATDDSLQLRGRITARLATKGPANRPEALKTVGTVDLASVSVMSPEMPAPIQDVNGQIMLREHNLTLKNVSAKMASSDLCVSGTVNDFLALNPEADAPGSARIDLEIKSRRIDLDELMPPAQETDSRMARRTAGTQKVETMPAAGALLARVDGVIAVEAGQLQVNGVLAREVRGSVTLDQGLVRFDGFGLKAFGGAVALQGKMDCRTPENLRFDLEVQARKVKASELYGYAKSLNRFGRLGGYLTGEIDVTAEMSGSLNDTLALDLDSFKSMGQLEARRAKISGHPLQNSLATYLEAPQLRTLSISDWLQPFRINNGRLMIDGLSMKADQVELTGNGWQSIDGSLQIALDILLSQKLSNGVRKKLPRALVPILLDGSDTRILLPIELTGTFTSPKVSLNTSRLSADARRRAEEKLAQELQRAEQQARDQAGKLLQDLLETEEDTTGAGKKGEELQKELEEKLAKEAKKLLKDLLKKK